ncbi:carbohydrate esterase family 3 protein [Xylariaceae sp. AK1471]|nr:carbohydrate esterase family 3 protein [Xylariaceae sp. AK1471]
MIANKFCLTLLAGAMAAPNGTLRYMPFGDSITEAVCWRALLWEKLQMTEFASVNWVGSGKADYICGDTKYDHDNEGHSGFLATDIANTNLLFGWLKNNPTDVITMHLGTNDIGHGRPVDQIIAAFTTLVGQMRASNPRMKIIVAQILPSTAAAWDTIIQNLNKAIPTWAQKHSRPESPIWVVDQYHGINSSDLRDGVHPNLAGDTKMANVWYPALIHALRVAKAEKAAEEVPLPSAA